MTEEEEFTPRVAIVTESEFSFMPPVRIELQEETPNGHRGDVWHLHEVEALALYNELGAYLRSREEI